MTTTTRNSTRQALHSLVDVVDKAELDVVYRILMKFIPESAALADEIKAIELARTAMKKKDDFVKHDGIDW